MKNILLTYVKDGQNGFDWFDNVNDMEVSIIERGIKADEIKDMIRIKDADDISLSMECLSCMEK